MYIFPDMNHLIENTILFARGVKECTDDFETNVFIEF